MWFKKNNWKFQSIGRGTGTPEETTSMICWYQNQYPSSHPSIQSDSVPSLSLYPTISCNTFRDAIRHINIIQQLNTRETPETNSETMSSSFARFHPPLYSCCFKGCFYPSHWILPIFPTAWMVPFPPLFTWSWEPETNAWVLGGWLLLLGMLHFFLMNISTYIYILP